MAFDAAKRNGEFDRIQCQIGKDSSSRGKRKRRVFLCKRTVRVKVKGKVIPASFRKIEGRGILVGAKDRREKRQLEEMVVDQTPGPEAPPRSKKRRERRKQRKCQERRHCQRSDGERLICQAHWVGGSQRIITIQYYYYKVDRLISTVFAAVKLSVANNNFSR